MPFSIQTMHRLDDVSSEQALPKVQSLFAEKLILFAKALKGSKEVEIPLRYEMLKSMAMANK
jgi:hypothetical protein